MKEIKSNNIDPSIKGVIEKLNNINIDFLVVGGLLSQYYLKDHSRFTKDVDILHSSNEEEIKEELKKEFGNIDFSSCEDSKTFYEPYFTCFVPINNMIGQIEGKKIDFLKEIRIEKYVYEGISFKGVCLEYYIAEKLVSLLNELDRPYKHVVDIYSLLQSKELDIDVEEIKKYMYLINNQENQYRKKNNIKRYDLPNQIREDKRFTPPYIVPTLQSKYNVNKVEMISIINKWLKTFL